ncbi:hypothetical protein [Roseivivax halotolerans]|uniref:hypothetical protein n=1 Tax=Roseivivax halotolerans TaxID=93684 RepID=UPI000B85C027|nr:hypothetical protein [Roseivivax halotolerans]
MQFLSDIFLAAGALGAALYCVVLSRRLRAFNDLEGGMGGAVAILSAQVEDLRKTLGAAQNSAGASTESLTALTSRAEDVARRLELLVASMHDLPEPHTTSAPEGPGIAAPVFSHRARQENAG